MADAVTAIGMMLGRLSPAPPGRAQLFPPRWRDEFRAAEALGLTHLEWLVTAESLADNPVFSAAGRARIASTARDSGITVTTINADLFVARPLLRVSRDEQRRGVDILRRLVEGAGALGATVINLPILEAGATRGVADENEVAALVSEIAGEAERQGIRIAIESELSGIHQRAWIDRCGAPLAACYDIGNAAAAGLDCGADIRAIGPRLASVHVKDRRRGGDSVPLGEGDARLAAACDALVSIGYDGPLILETPVGADPMASARVNLSVLRSRLATVVAV